MICSKCGKEIKDDAQFCNFCGTPVEQPKKEIKKKKKTPVIILVAVLCLALIGGGLFFLLGKENPTEKTDTSRIEANLANFGYGCEIGEDTYISFPEGILKVTKENIRLNEAPENVYASDEGISQFYSDFVSEGNMIYCLSSETADNKTIYHFHAFDVSEKKMYQLFTHETQSSTCYALNKIGNKIYYYVDGSLAFIDTEEDYKSSSVSLHSTGISTGNSGVLKVTDSGVFCSTLGDKGLKLLSYEGKLKCEYENLKDKKVGFWYEKNGKALITLSDEDKTLYTFDTKTGDYSKFTEEDIFENVIYMQHNWYEDTLFISTIKYVQDEGCYKYFVYAFSSDGKLIQTVCNDEMNDFGFANMLILNDIMYISNPLSGGDVYLKIYELPTLKSIG